MFTPAKNEHGYQKMMVWKIYLLSSMASFLGYLLVIFFGAVPTPSRFDVSMLLTGETGEALSLQSCLELAGLEMSEEASLRLTG